MRVKICGMNDAAAYETAVDAGADYVGFVFFPRSPRFVTPAQAAAIRAVRPGSPPAVGLFVKPELDQIAAVLETMPLDIFQIYGTPELAQAIRARFGRPVWLARGVSSRGELPAAEDAGQGLDALMIESKPPPGADRPGGNATALDWSILAGWTPALPWLLAGGLTPENVAEAIAASGAMAVDVSSGVESSPGVKDLTRIRNFITASRNAAPGLSASTDAEYESTGQGVS
ncbi:phosphoribosylanthranilate isomerase [Acidisoma cellulosilytica]|uniref:N-(5'-phosphoribosyl)anthranilate isomerase n=1 Tax=Acidisoma cellulosilyticum TaxID=2802395 RepID=A0A964E207_9PROT|nr:phosphoribosylanthranilate isomerase [Acidisoma cellulosilyticum]MCB8878911.1 phosphoribosylanthranilate isomerase [Acidisoma cellulosilyticum]